MQPNKIREYADIILAEFEQNQYSQNTMLRMITRAYGTGWKRRTNSRRQSCLYRQTVRVYAAGRHLTKRKKQIKPSCGAR